MDTPSEARQIDQERRLDGNPLPTLAQLTEEIEKQKKVIADQAAEISRLKAYASNESKKCDREMSENADIDSIIDNLINKLADR